MFVDEDTRVRLADLMAYWTSHYLLRALSFPRIRFSF